MKTITIQLNPIEHVSILAKKIRSYYRKACRDFRDRHDYASWKRWRKWSPEEDAVLLSSLSHSKVAKQLGRSYNGVRSRARTLRDLNLEEPKPTLKLEDSVLVERYLNRRPERGWRPLGYGTIEFKLAKKEYDRKRYLKQKAR